MDQYLVQPFYPKGKGLVAGQPIATKTAANAVKEAGRIGESCGAAALHVNVDDDTGVVIETKVLSRVGRLPENFDDVIGA